jgi:hypothetical protein
LCICSVFEKRNFFLTSRAHQVFNDKYFLSIKAFPKLQFWESSLEIRGFARLKA